MGELAHPLTIRGHHLLCLLGFRGRGYSPAFVEAMRRVSEVFRFDLDASIVLVTWCDVICASCPHNIDDECRKSPDAASRIKDKDAAILKKLGFRANALTTPREAWERVRENFTPGDITAMCGRCQWLELGYCVEGLTRLRGSNP
ncbi:MAG: DUF1284 domain-containing protein [Dehalococcoidales bacterium]|nr:DUF1284 domain-containing protein [Dehalococcoidales bacterium]